MLGRNLNELIVYHDKNYPIYGLKFKVGKLYTAGLFDLIEFNKSIFFPTVECPQTEISRCFKIYGAIALRLTAHFLPPNTWKLYYFLYGI